MCLPSELRARAARSAAAATIAVLLLVAVLAVAAVPAWADVRPGAVKTLYTGVASIDGAVIVEGTRTGAKARLDATVLFGKDSAVLRPGARERIRQVAREFTRTGPGKVLVVGHTDDLGPADHGLRLSVRRAAAVADVLGRLLPSRDYPMTAVGKGEQDPAVPNTSEANRRKNRRVIITLDRAGSDTGAPTDNPRPTPPLTTTAPPTPTSTPTTSATTSSASATPSPTPTTATPSAAPTTSAGASGASTPAGQASDSPVPGPGGDAPQGSRFFDPTFVSNLFLALVLLAGALLVLRRLRRPDDPDQTPATGSDRNPPSSGGGADADPGDAGPGESAGRDTPTRDGDLRRTDQASGAAGSDHTSGAVTGLDLHTPIGPAVEYVSARHGSHPERRPAPAGSAAAPRDLDADLRAWHSDRCDLPRLSLLGPVTVQAHGAPIARRRPFYTELLTFLALRPHGATPDQVAAAFSLTPARVRNDMKVLRDWLGTNPRTGRRHLPDARDTAAGRARGMAVYQVEGLLVDLHMFDRLIQRADAAGPDSVGDLDQALRLVRGRPFDQLRPHGWEWLFEGGRIDLHTEAAIQRATDRLDRLRHTDGPQVGEGGHAALLHRATGA